MTASLETLVIAAYVFAASVPIPRPGPEGKISDAELVALAVAQAATGESSDRKFLGMIAYQLAVAELIAEGRVRLADGTLLSCANYPGCASRSHFAGEAAYGRSPSKSQFIWGMRLVLVTDPKGVPVGYDLVGPKTGRERQAVVDLACGLPGTILFCDKGLWGRELEAMIEHTGVELITPERHRLGEPPPAELAQ